MEVHLVGKSVNPVAMLTSECITQYGVRYLRVGEVTKIIGLQEERPYNMDFEKDKNKQAYQVSQSFVHPQCNPYSQQMSSMGAI